MSLYKKVFLIVSLSVFTGMAVSFYSIKVNSAMILISILTTLIFGSILKNAALFNTIIIPQVIFWGFTLFVLSGALIKLTGNVFIDELSFILIACFFMISYSINPSRFKTVISINSYWICFILFSVFGIVSTFANSVPSNIAMRGGILIHKPIIIFFLFSLIFITRDSAKKILDSIHSYFVFILLLSVVWSILFEILLPNNPVPGSGNMYSSYLHIKFFRSFFTHPNAYSSIMIILSNYFFATYLYKKDKKDLVLFFISVFAMVSSFRAKILLLFPITVLIIYSLYTSKEKKKLFSLRKIIAAIVITTVLIISFSFLKTKLGDYAFTTNARKAIFLTSLKITQEKYGFGAGFGRFGSAVSARYYSPLYYKYNLHYIYGIGQKHRGFITDQWWGWFIGEAGILGMSFFLAGIFFIIKKLRYIGDFWHTKSQEVSILAYTSIGALFFGVFSGFASGSLSGPPASYIIMGIPAVVIKLHLALQKEQSPKIEFEVVNQ